MGVGGRIAPSALGLALSLSCCIARGQTSATPTPTVRIAGVVLHEGGAPAQYEAVRLRLPGARDFLASVPTDSDGRFIFAAVPAKKYEVVVDAAGSIKAVDASDGSDAD